MKYSMKCSCGDVMDVEAGSRDEAVSKMKAMMSEEAINAHMKEKHPDKPAITVAECHAMIDKELAEVSA